MEDITRKLLALLTQEDGISAAKAAKKLALPQSQLLRLLTALGDNPAFGGLGLIHTQEAPGRLMIYLTTKGRAQCQQN